MNIRATALICAGMACSAAAEAETLKKVPAQLRPDRAYVLVEYKLQKNPFAGFPGSRKTLPLSAGLSFARYDPRLKDVRGLGRAAANPAPAGKAVEAFRNRPLASADGARLFLLELEPDTWVIQGYGNTAFSLGSYSFALKPGAVVDLGVVSAELDWAQGQTRPNGGHVLGAAVFGPFAKRPDVAPLRASFRPRQAGDISIPAALSARGVAPVMFESGAVFGNYLGGLVNRIEGVNATDGSSAQ